MTMTEATARTHEYEFWHSDWELERLRRQAELVAPITLQFYRDAGIAKGMRVLDVGCGAGWDPLESTCRHASLSIL